MRTGSLTFLLVRKCLCVSVSMGKPSIYFLMHIGYPRVVPACPVVPRRRRRPSRRPSKYYWRGIATKRHKSENKSNLGSRCFVIFVNDVKSRKWFVFKYLRMDFFNH